MKVIGVQAGEEFFVTMTMDIFECMSILDAIKNSNRRDITVAEMYRQLVDVLTMRNAGASKSE
jgi:hypothetical protein